MSEDKKGLACLWKHRAETLGIAMIIISTLMIIFTRNSLGISVMLVVGALLCCRSIFSCRCCCSSSACKSSDCDTQCEDKAKKAKS